MLCASISDPQPDNPSPPMQFTYGFLKWSATMALIVAMSGRATAQSGVGQNSAAGDTARQSTSKAVGADILELAKEGLGSGGSVGVAAWRLDGKGPTLLVNTDDTFPMASTFKVAVAGAVLKLVDERRLDLGHMIPIDLDRMVYSEVIADRFIHPGISLSVYNLLELMLTQSDNTAADYMVAAAGGPDAVTAWVRTQNVRDLRVNGDTDALLRRFFRLGQGTFAEAVSAKAKDDPSFQADAYKPNADFDDDPRDSSTPRAMAQLLTRIFNGQALSAESTRIMTEMMARCRTGTKRLRGRMPLNSPVADKTGTIGGSVNDVGVITLPHDAGQVAIAVFIKKSDAPEEVREQAIAEIGRAVRDYYLYGARP
jgi:beta-lactamase class A